MKGIIFDIKRFAVHDGPGIRTTVFLKGCPLHCDWCHNPEGIDMEPRGKYGREVSVAEVMQEIEKETVFYDESGGGATFSGGEPLMQPAFLAALLDRCRQRQIHTTLDTSGYAPPEVFENIGDKVDLFLYDLKIMDEERHSRCTGVSNRWIVDNLKTLVKKGKRVFIRFPVVPGVTDTPENIRQVAAFVGSLNHIERLDLLAYHRTGAEKYKRLNMTERLARVNPPPADRLAAIKNEFEAVGLTVQLGG
jgi:pyruvate formate lyase activating enzyme